LILLTLPRHHGNMVPQPDSYSSGRRHCHAHTKKNTHTKELIMKRQQQGVFLTGLLAIMLAGCSSMDSTDGTASTSAASTSSMASDDGTSTPGSGSYGSSTGGTTTGGTTASGTTAGGTTAGGTTASGTTASGTTDSGSGGSGDSSASGQSTTGSSGGSTASDTRATGQTAQTEQAASALRTPNSTVTSIEIVQRQGAGATGSGTAGASTAAGAATGTTMGERVYRITLRMDDGSSQVITQEWAPTFSTGDRVRMNSGAIQR
jgi:hypothetical protein